MNLKELILEQPFESNSRKVAEISADIRIEPLKESIWPGVLVIGAGFLLITPILSAHRVTDFMIFCIFVMSFDLLYGYMGRLSFGHLLFLGTGAYGSGLFIKYISGNPILAIFIGIIAAGLLAMILGLIIVRTTGACFALINLAFNHIGFFLVLSKPFF